MITHFRLMFPDMKSGIDGRADYERDLLILELPDGEREFSLSHARHVLDKPYHILEPEGGWKQEFTDAEKAKLRPIAETLAMMDGNAFFGNESGGGKEWYEMYLPQADAIFSANGGDSGWAGEASFAKAPKDSVNFEDKPETRYGAKRQHEKARLPRGSRAKLGGNCP